MTLKQLLIESLFGVKLITKVNDAKYLTLVSKNTRNVSTFYSRAEHGVIGGEQPYRITWFTMDGVPIVHADFSEDEMKNVVTTMELPERVKDKFGRNRDNIRLFKLLK